MKFAFLVILKWVRKYYLHEINIRILPLAPPPNIESNNGEFSAYFVKNASLHNFGSSCTQNILDTMECPCWENIKSQLSNAVSTIPLRPWVVKLSPSKIIAILAYFSFTPYKPTNENRLANIKTPWFMHKSIKIVNPRQTKDSSSGLLHMLDVIHSQSAL